MSEQFQPPPPASELKWPFGQQVGEWQWKSFTDGDYAGHTVIGARCTGPLGGLQYLVLLDWSHFEGRPEVGRVDAEDHAKLICAAVNEFLKNHPELKP